METVPHSKSSMKNISSVSNALDKLKDFRSKHGKTISTVCVFQLVALQFIANISVTIAWQTHRHFLECFWWTVLGVAVFSLLSETIYACCKHCVDNVEKEVDFDTFFGKVIELCGHRENWLPMLAMFQGFAWYIHFHSELAHNGHGHEKAMKDFMLKSGALGCIIPAACLGASEFFKLRKPHAANGIPRVVRRAPCWHKHCGSLPYAIVGIFLMVFTSLPSTRELGGRVAVYFAYTGIVAGVLVLLLMLIGICTNHCKIPGTGEVEVERPELEAKKSWTVRLLFHHGRWVFVIMVLFAAVKVLVQYTSERRHVHAIEPDGLFYCYLFWIISGDLVDELLAELSKYCTCCEHNASHAHLHHQQVEPTNHGKQHIVFYY